VWRAAALAGFLPAASSLEAEGQLLKSEADLVWTYRVLIVAGTENRRAVLEAARDDIEERDLLWFLYQGDLVATNSPHGVAPALVESLRGRVSASRGDVVLVGKDSGVKLTTDNLDLPAIFARIDAMPMRRREMRR
jgi:hypothetical protein